MEERENSVWKESHSDRLGRPPEESKEEILDILIE